MKDTPKGPPKYSGRMSKQTGIDGAEVVDITFAAYTEAELHDALKVCGGALDRRRKAINEQIERACEAEKRRLGLLHPQEEIGRVQDEVLAARRGGGNGAVASDRPADA